MNFTEVNLQLTPDNPQNRELLMAALDELGYDSFWEEEDIFRAYISGAAFDEKKLRELQQEFGQKFSLSFTADDLPDQNWNEIWESNFDPVKINDHCGVRAPFHPSFGHIEYEIIIEPQMSFGTAHHETTAMMLDYLTFTSLEGKKVLDMGSGTGVLAIMAKLKGATEATAIDNDNWAVANTKDNIRRNNVDAEVLAGDIDTVSGRSFDLILANINRNILLRHIPLYAEMLTAGGSLMTSGFYIDDLEAIKNKAENHGFIMNDFKDKRNWVAARFTKR